MEDLLSDATSELSFPQMSPSDKKMSSSGSKDFYWRFCTDTSLVDTF